MKTPGRTPDRGAALVEFALILPIIVILTFGMMSSAIAYNHKLDLTHAAREGARYGARLALTQCSGSPNPCGGTTTWAEVVRSVVVQRAMGDVSAADVCVALVHGTVATPTTPTSSYSTGGGVGFAESGAETANRVQVKITKNNDTIDAAFFRFAVTMSSQATGKYEE